MEQIRNKCESTRTTNKKLQLRKFSVRASGNRKIVGQQPQFVSSAARMRPKRPWPPPKQTRSDFLLVLYMNSNCSMPTGRRYMALYPVVIDQKLSYDMKMIFVQNGLDSDDVSDWPLPNKILCCATASCVVVFPQIKWTLHLNGEVHSGGSMGGQFGATAPPKPLWRPLEWRPFAVNAPLFGAHGSRNRF